MKEIIKELQEMSEAMFDEKLYAWSDQLDETIDKLKAISWISVSDKLPEFGASVLIKWGDNKDNISIGEYNSEIVRGKRKDRWYWRGRLSPFDITHWMPLPKP